MPEPTVSSNSFDFFDAPSGDSSLDDIFIPGDENNSNSNTPVVTEQQTEVSSEPFLKTSTGSVYKSADEAVRGIEHKDALILELRQKLSDQNGVDPLRKRTPEVEDPGLMSYIENPKKYFADLNEAAKSGDEAKILAVQQRFVEENTARTLAPYAGILSNAIKSQAVESVSGSIPKFQEFLGSEDYKTTLENYPLLKRSIEISESNPQQSGDLGQLYRMAYEVSNGRNLPKIVEANRANPQLTTRPTVSSTQPTPVGQQRVAQPTMGSSDGRKSIIAQQEANNVENLRF